MERTSLTCNWNRSSSVWRRGRRLARFGEHPKALGGAHQQRTNSELREGIEDLFEPTVGEKPGYVVPAKIVLFQSLDDQLAGAVDSYSFEPEFRIDAIAMGQSDMGQDLRQPVLLVSCDDSQVVAEIHVELVDAVSERLDQC